MKTDACNLVHPKLNEYFQWINGKLPVKDKNNPTLIELTSGYPLRATKAVWGLYLPLQIVGLFNERVGKLARAFYGVCWSIVYSCYRPFATNRKTLGGDKASSTIKNLYNINEHFRLGMGTLVSAIYGSGAFGMLWGAVTGNDDFFDKSAEVYTTGMLNQNQIFASMNTEVVLSRKYNNTDEQLSKTNQQKGCFKSGIELTDAILFIPNIITRGLDTFRLFGMELGEGTKRIVNALGYFSYGTWAARFGKLKTLKAQGKNGEESGGDLEILNPELKGTATGLDKALQETQETSGKVFHTLLPAISWASTVLELFGLSELAKKVFKLEGILERLHPTIATWCIRDTWLKLFKINEEKPANNKQEIPIHEQQAATQVEEKDEPVILSLPSQNMEINFQPSLPSKTSTVNTEQKKPLWLMLEEEDIGSWPEEMPAKGSKQHEFLVKKYQELAKARVAQ